MIQVTELYISEEISAGLEVCDTYTPPAGSEVYMYSFHGNAAFTPNSSVLVIWDYEGPDEQIIWSTKGTDSTNDEMLLPTPDGVKEVALCCRNGESGPIAMSGCVRLRIKT